MRPNEEKLWTDEPLKKIDFSFADAGMKSYYESIENAMTCMELVIARCTNNRDASSLQAMQTICGELFRRAAEHFQNNTKYRINNKI